MAAGWLRGRKPNYGETYQTLARQSGDQTDNWSERKRDRISTPKSILLHQSGLIPRSRRKLLRCTGSGRSLASTSPRMLRGPENVAAPAPARTAMANFDRTVYIIITSSDCPSSAALRSSLPLARSVQCGVTRRWAVCIRQR